jgi:hypothetical protein
MVAPTESEGVLALFLDLTGTVSHFPVRSFFREKEVARSVHTDEIDHFLLDIQDVRNAVGIIIKVSLARPPKCACFDHRLDALRRRRFQNETAVTEAFHCVKLVAAIVENQRLSQTGAKIAFDLRREIVSRDEVHKRLDSDCKACGDSVLTSVAPDQDPRHRRLGMIVNLGAGRSRNGHSDQPRRQQLFSVFGTDREIVDPFVKIRPGPVPHVAGEPACKRVLVKKSKNKSP